MTSLRETQLAFAQVLTGPANAGAAAFAKAGRLPAERRLQIYRNNFRLGLCGALQALFPVTRRLVGEGFFGCAAGAYAVEAPSLCGDIHAYGATFPEFIAARPGAEQLPYLADLARLEWAFHLVFHAADSHPLRISALAEVPPGDWPRLRLALAPATALLRSAYPTLRIWQVNQDVWAGEASVRLDEGGNDVLVLRREGEVALLALEAGEMAFLGALAGGHPLAQALDAARDDQIAFDLAVTLSKHLRLGTFAEGRTTRP